MRFVETKTPEQQSCLMLHRTRHLLIRQQTAVDQLCDVKILLANSEPSTHGTKRPIG
jgi:hypothetical protein